MADETLSLPQPIKAKKKGSPAIIDRRGMKYGRLTVVDRAPNRFQAGGKSIIMWNCICDCGVVVAAQSDRLSSGKTQSCGCLKREVTSKMHLKSDRFKHGLSASREYRSWRAAIGRVFDDSRKNYHNYGGRGITMCDRWLNSFEAFLEDMGARPRGTTLDRIDNNRDYEPGNCRWATQEEQQRNRRVTVFIRIGDISKTVMEWSEISGVPVGTIRSRRKAGWTSERAVFEPVIR